MAVAEKLNTKELLDRSAKWLAERGCESARLEAEILLAEVLGCSRLDLYVQWDRPVVEREKNAFREMLRRRGEMEPIAYIVGHKEFYSLDFAVGPGALVPRPETEFVVEEVLNNTGEDESFRMADIGTGSGAIAVAVAVHRPEAMVVASDISSEALGWARRNVAKHELTERVAVREGALLDALRGEVDWIVSNPPYIPESDRPTLPEDVAKYEPSGALFAGDQGLDIVEQLIAKAPEHLRPGGWLVMEIGHDQAHAVCGLIEAAGAYEAAEIRRDYSDIERVIVARKRGE
jgi:release factor glutamine methyltransferase